jgi:hypothetical protein
MPCWTHVNWLIFVMESGTEPDIKLTYRARKLSETVGKRNRGDESTANASSA